ncbi:15917_t:CDS:2 [Dentiscutata erythropus]|uniref:15917_t:CDS:1 n=1 Tax=Dentiscutata erythropus TaxID=1348616 RepID=A0A9N9J833_9GLOM|nr:15917_t:CDS:2 [Dentiscutata erythropus]
MNENLMCEWVDQVLNKRPGVLTINKPLLLLVMDSFEGHHTDMCGISNELNRTEDDLLYDSDKENSEIDNNKDLTEIVEDSLSANELEE